MVGLGRGAEGTAFPGGPGAMSFTYCTVRAAVWTRRRKRKERREALFRSFDRRVRRQAAASASASISSGASASTGNATTVPLFFAGFALPWAVAIACSCWRLKMGHSSSM